MREREDFEDIAVASCRFGCRSCQPMFCGIESPGQGREVFKASAATCEPAREAHFERSGRFGTKRQNEGRAGDGLDASGTVGHDCRKKQRGACEAEYWQEKRNSNAEIRQSRRVSNTGLPEQVRRPCRAVLGQRSRAWGMGWSDLIEQGQLSSRLQFPRLTVKLWVVAQRLHTVNPPGDVIAPIWHAYTRPFWISSGTGEDWCGAVVGHGDLILVGEPKQAADNRLVKHAKKVNVSESSGRNSRQNTVKRFPKRWSPAFVYSDHYPAAKANPVLWCCDGQNLSDAFLVLYFVNALGSQNEISWRNSIPLAGEVGRSRDRITHGIIGLLCGPSSTVLFACEPFFADKPIIGN